MQAVKGKTVKIPTFLAEVRLVFQTARPGSSPCPAVSRDTGLHEKGFPETLNKAELSKQKGVYTAGPTLGRDQGCRSASRQLRPSASPYIAGAQVSARSASARAGPARTLRPQRCHRAGRWCHQKRPQGRRPFSFRQLILGGLLGSGGWFPSSSWGSPRESVGASALFDTRKTSAFPSRRLLNLMIWVLLCACCCHEIQPDSLQLPQHYTHLDEKKKKKNSRRRKNR